MTDAYSLVVKMIKNLIKNFEAAIVHQDYNHSLKQPKSSVVINKS